AHPREEALVATSAAAEVARLDGLAELPGDLLLLHAQVGGDDHVDDDDQVAGRAAVGARKPIAAQHVLGAVLGSGGNLDLALALVARDPDRGPEHRFQRRDLPRVDEGLAAHRAPPHFEAGAPSPPPAAGLENALP